MVCWRSLFLAKRRTDKKTHNEFGRGSESVQCKFERGFVLHRSIKKFSGKENEGDAASWFESIKGMS